MNKKYFLNSLLVIFSLTFLSCGGSTAGSEKPLNEIAGSEPPPNKDVELSTSTNFSKYAWNINPLIDPNFKSKYSIDSNAHINISSAWNKTKGENTIVAIIDEDFEPTHPDIKESVLHTYNVMNKSSNVENTNSYNTFSHGTFVSGVVASKYLGVAPNTKLILINIDLAENSSDISTSTDVHLLEAFDYAKNKGAKIINCSWGGGVVSQALSDKITSLKNAGITVIFASGNDGIDLDNSKLDEAELDSVIGVGATNEKNDVTSYSNYGSKIDILAPGGEMPGVISLDLLGDEGVVTSNTNTILNYNYAVASGTSFAAPAVSGVVALMLSANPDLTPDQIRQAIIDTADKIGLSDDADYTKNNFDKKRAYGKINASKAVQEAINNL